MVLFLFIVKAVFYSFIRGRTLKRCYSTKHEYERVNTQLETFVWFRPFSKRWDITENTSPSFYTRVLRFQYWL